MSQPKGSTGVAVAVAVLIVIAVTSLGYYQFVYCSPASCSTSTSTSTSAAVCAPPACVTIQINPGASTLTTTAFSPDSARLVIGVNNTFQVYNNDSQSGGVAHTMTADDCKTTATSCSFDTGIIQYGQYSKIFAITKPGTYSYYCEIHPSTMVGTITVVAGSGTATLPPQSSVTTTASATTSTSQSSAATKGVSVSMPSGAGTGPSAAPGYAPENLTVIIGVNNTVTWTNNDTVSHTVTSLTVPAGATKFDSGIMSAGATFTQTFTVPGTYEYHCSLHSWMTGSVTVKSA